MFDGAGDVYADAVGAVGFIAVAVSAVAKGNVDASDVAVGTSAVVCTSRCCLRLCNTPKTWISDTLLNGFMAEEEIEK